MNSIVTGAVFYLLQQFLFGLMNLATTAMTAIQKNAYTTVEHSQIVKTMENSTQIIAFTALGLFIAFHAVKHYIMWNDGTALDDGTLIYKGIFKGAFGIIGSSAAAYLIFKFGSLLAAALLTSPINALQQLNTNSQHLATTNIGSRIIMILLTLVCVIGVFVALIRMMGYMAELAFHAIAGPLAALFDISPNSNIFSGWIASITTLSLSTAVQWVGIGLIAAAVQVGGFSGIALALGAVVMLFRGTHLMKQWINYRTGTSTVVSAAVAAKAAQAFKVFG